MALLDPEARVPAAVHGGRPEHGSAGKRRSPSTPRVVSGPTPTASSPPWAPELVLAAINWSDVQFGHLTPADALPTAVPPATLLMWSSPSGRDDPLALHACPARG